MILPPFRLLADLVADQAQHRSNLLEVLAELVDQLVGVPPGAVQLLERPSSSSRAIRRRPAAALSFFRSV